MPGCWCPAELGLPPSRCKETWLQNDKEWTLLVDIMTFASPDVGGTQPTSSAQHSSGNT